MPTPHKHAAVIKAWADGAEIEFKTYNCYPWQFVKDPSWNPFYEYRVKPPPPHKWQKEMDAFAAGKTIEYKGHPADKWWPSRNPVWLTFDGCEYRVKPEEVVRYVGAHPSNLKLTFEDGKLTKAEILK